MANHNIADSSTLVGWRKSSYSGSQGGGCIEVLDSYPAGVPVRDSKDPNGPAFIMSAVGWSAFVSAAKAGQLTA